MTDQYATETNISPYTGRPISEWLDEDIELHDLDGDEIGNIVEINPDFIVAQANTGFLGLGEPRIYFIPRSYVAREEGDDWYLSIDKDEIESMGWSQAPADSAWSQEWREGQYNTESGRGQTRLRRYEEDVEVDKVQREAGEVVVSKHVVEETKSFEVPVRREEVHVERRPVSGDQAVGAAGETEGAFSEETVRVPVMEEEVEIRKVARPVEEIEVTKSATDETRQVDTTVRREEFDVDDRTGR